MTLKSILGAIAAAVTLSAPAMAQTWQQLPISGGKVVVAIDTSKIKKDGDWRIFRTRTGIQKSPDFSIGVIAMDCKLGRTEILSQRSYAKGKMVKERVFEPAKRPRQKIPNPRKDPMFRLICG